MTAQPIYLDHNATAPLSDVAREAMIDAMGCVGNPSSIHRSGRAARAILDSARESVATAVGAKAEGVIFTSGATEANAMALAQWPGPVLVSAVEHPCVLAANPSARTVPVDPYGRVDLAALERALAGAVAEDAGPVLVSVMLVNNETGVIQPVAEASAITHQLGGVFHTDAVQAAGRVPIEMDALGADLLSLSAHKFAGPKGTGALIARGKVDIHPLIRGGGQERRRRAGTENVPAIAGFGAVAANLDAGLARQPAMAEIRAAMERRLVEAVPGTQIFGAEVERVANTCMVAMPGVTAETQLMAFDLAGFAVSSGSACSSGKVEPSHVLAAMGVESDVAEQAIRVSFGPGTPAEALSAFADAWCALYARRARGSAPSAAARNGVV